jgi:hypothetical protein
MQNQDNQIIFYYFSSYSAALIISANTVAGARQAAEKAG